jgi:nucleotide-binding universal stress UspA family protein
MFEKILYPTDFSDVSNKALEYIKQLKEAGAKEVIVLHVINDREIEHLFRHAEPLVTFKGVVKKIEEHANKEIRAVEDYLKKSGLDVKTRIEKGIPFRNILRVEEEEKVSAIVIGSHGKSNIKEMFLGSVSEKVIRKSSKLVLVVRR